MSERLDRIEAILAGLAESNQAAMARHEQHEQEMAEFRQGLQETKAITDSNARAIAAWGEEINDKAAEVEEQTTTWLADLGGSMRGFLAMEADSRERHREHDQRFNALLEDARADRERSDQRHQEQDQRFNTLLEDAQADRARSDERFEAMLTQLRDQAQVNDAEHQAFQEIARTMLAEISRLWQRLAG